MKNRDFADINQASQYLRNSIIMIGGAPCYVHEVGGSANRLTLSYSRINGLNNNLHNIALKDKAVDMNPVPLGMCLYTGNGSYETYYVSRYPARKWHVGLARDNMNIAGLLGKGDVTRPLTPSLFATPNLEDCIMGRYKSVSEIHKIFENFRGTVPFSRRFAVSHTGDLIFKTVPEKVGSVSKKGGPKLLSDYSYLEEVLQEDMDAHN